MFKVDNKSNKGKEKNDCFSKERNSFRKQCFILSLLLICVLFGSGYSNAKNLNNPNNLNFDKNYIYSNDLGKNANSIKLNNKTITVNVIDKTVKPRFNPFVIMLNDDKILISSGQAKQQSKEHIGTNIVRYQNGTEIYSMKENKSTLVSDSSYTSGILLPNDKVLLLGNNLDTFDIKNNKFSTLVKNANQYLTKYGTKIQSALPSSVPVYYLVKNNDKVFCICTLRLTEINLKNGKIKDITQFFSGYDYNLINENEILFIDDVNPSDYKDKGTNYYVYNIEKNNFEKISDNNFVINKINYLATENKIICCGYVNENKIRIDVIDKNKKIIQKTIYYENYFNPQDEIQMFEFENNIYFFQKCNVKMSLDINRMKIKAENIKFADDKFHFAAISKNKIFVKN